MAPRARFRARQRLDKYRIVRRIAAGGFAEVYEAFDTIEGVPVALKIPLSHLVDRDVLAGFKREVRHTAKLEHPHVLPVKTAGFVGDHFVIVQPLAKETLLERLKRRVARRKQVEWTDQLLGALAHAHEQGVLHCDVKPENVLVFAGDRLRLADFGISKLAQRTVAAGGTGTLGYVAPEQAMGKPSPRSDVFSMALVLWRLFTGELPEWPFRKPMPGWERLARVHPELRSWLERALAIDERERYRDAGAMRAAWLRLRPRVLAGPERARRRKQPVALRPDWKQVQQRQFRRAFSSALRMDGACGRCEGPLHEAMLACPWCGAERKRLPRDDAPTGHTCPRCRRGVKADWPYCAWCYGAAIGPITTRSLPDRRYAGSCGHCRGDLLPFSRYCPWCRRKVTRSWAVEGSRERCGRCRNGVVTEFWRHCPWCARSLPSETTRGRRR